ncbi:MAG TPA: flippase [Candidatus Limnocylindrales bacterium]|nr:flippase [Candidatus Limnocylindrales bacterium]
MSEASGPSDNLLDALRGRAMARNTVWNAVGQFTPLLIAVFAIPLLIRKLGVDRFGILTLAWVLVGYFSFFDLGLGRALTKVVSDRLAAGKQRELAGAVWSALTMMLGLGTVFAIGISLSSNWLAGSLLKVPPALFHETVKSLYVLAVSVPIITLISGLRGVLEAGHHFAMVNAVRVVMGAFSFLGPLLAAFFSPSLFPVITVLVAGRLVSALAYFLMCLHTTPSLKTGFFFDRSAVPELMSTGSWIMVSNLVGPVMTYLDRFLITYFLSVSVVAYYTTPFELVTKLWLVPTSIGAVLFPAFAALAVIDQQKLKLTYARGVRSCFVLLFPIVFLIVLFAPEGLRLWLGPVFAAKSTIIVRWLALGVLINSLAQIPYALLQAVHRPDLPGKVHLVEVPLYIAAAALAIHNWGLPGAAAVWALRLCLESLVLFFLARRILVPRALSPGFLAIVSVAIALLVGATFEAGLVTKVLSAAVVLALYVVAAWRLALEDQERNHLRALLTSFTLSSE